MRHLVLGILLILSLASFAQKNKETQFKPTQIKSGNEYYEYVLLDYSNFLTIEKTSFIKPKMTNDEEQLSYFSLSKNITVNKDDIVSILKKFAKKDINRNGFNDYYIVLKFFIDKNTYLVKHINFYLPKSLLKDVKQINQLEKELTNQTKFKFAQPPVPTYFKPSYISVTVLLNEKDLVGKF